ncbi:SRPBCC family protein [Mycobacteroides abscessus]|uniref:SRPBCC family protein n=1 Tax=Mycobacteroides abscessus TaxID=36809 RepID=UPI0009A898B6|nr:SRPBCC family protein [Mycobacteroides abscessus]RIT40445.1 SRPBCC family protein [Mycobacteroides abscessus]SKT94047.1 Uncharacterised protein [Mycobacteroides abscessus subsp. massiliense]SKU18837.1 Uncharacterised protein [Mycobacteroides abscessus subsp. massiliense]
MPVILGVAAALLIIGGLIAVAVLGALASGARGPQRFDVSDVGQDFTGYFDKSASWAATASVELPGDAEHVWQKLSAGRYLDVVPFVTGPTINDKDLSYRAVLIALSERIVRSVPYEEIIAVGTGLSIPLLLKSFGERWTITENDKGVTVQWTVAFTPQWIGWFPMRWTAFVVRPFMGAILRLAL